MENIIILDGKKYTIIPIIENENENEIFLIDGVEHKLVVHKESSFEIINNKIIKILSIDEYLELSLKNKKEI